MGVGYAIEACSQIVWIHWQLVVKQAPAMSLGDAGIYLAWTALILAFALRPHAELTTQHQRLGTLDLLLLCYGACTCTCSSSSHGSTSPPSSSPMVRPISILRWRRT